MDLRREDCAGSIIDGMNRHTCEAMQLGGIILVAVVGAIGAWFAPDLEWFFLNLAVTLSVEGVWVWISERSIRKDRGRDHDAHWHAEQLRWWLRLERKRDSFRTMSGSLLRYLRIEVHRRGEMLRENVEWMHDQFRDRMDQSEQLPRSEKDVETLLRGLMSDDQVKELASAVWRRWETHCMGRAGG